MLKIPRNLQKKKKILKTNKQKITGYKINTQRYAFDILATDLKEN